MSFSGHHTCAIGPISWFTACKQVLPEITGISLDTNSSRRKGDAAPAGRAQWTVYALVRIFANVPSVSYSSHNRVYLLTEGLLFETMT